MFSLHTEALCWLRYGKRMPIVCTEGGYWNADVVGLNAAMCIEVEVKKSIADLRADFKNKAHKHYVYRNADKFDRSTASGYVPNYMYFIVDEDLAEKARKVIDAEAPKVGLAVRSRPATQAWGAGKRNIYIAKRPVKLHDRKPAPSFIRSAVMRMSSEVCTFRLTAERLKSSESAVLLKDLMNVVVGIEGTLDFEDPAPDLERRGAEMAFVVEGKTWEQLNHVERTRWMFAAQKLLLFRREANLATGEIT